MVCPTRAMFKSRPACFGIVALMLAANPLLAEETQEGLMLQGLELVGEQELSDNRGRADLNVDEIILQLSEANANASVSNNTLDSNMTGSNLVETGAFDGAAGVIFSVQNSGNHVVIQNTTLINVTMSP